MTLYMYNMIKAIRETRKSYAVTKQLII